MTCGGAGFWVFMAVALVSIVAYNFIKLSAREQATLDKLFDEYQSEKGVNHGR